MVQFAPILLNFNGGEVSPSMQARVDHQKYPSMASRIENFMLTAQGMMVKRGGSRFAQRCIDPDFASELIPFVFSNDEVFVLEFGETEIRFHTNDGVVLEASQGGTVGSATSLTVTGHGYSTGDYLFISGTSGQQNGKIIEISAVPDANTITLAESLDVTSGSITVAKVYQITHGYTSTDLPQLDFEQSGNTMYIVHKDYRPQQLVRIANDNWSFSEFALVDGPYLDINGGATVLELSASGDVAQFSGTSGSANNGGSVADALDGDLTEGSDYTSPNGYIQMDLGAGNAVKPVGYAVGSSPTSTSSRSPAAWRLIASNDATNWDTLSLGTMGDGWQKLEVRLTPVFSNTAYRYYRLQLLDSANGTSNVSLSWFGLLPQPEDGETIIVDASNTTDINGGQGFLATDVGRHIRLLDPSGFWVWGKITVRNSTTRVRIVLENYPLTAEIFGITSFRLGQFSDTTGWPSSVQFHQNRLVLSGGVPIGMSMSASGAYNYHAPTADPFGVVTDADAINIAIASRMGDGSRWMFSTRNNLVLATGSEEWVVGSATSDEALSPTNTKADRMTNYGSQFGMKPVEVERALLFFDKTKTRLREFAYVFEIDAFSAPDLNLMADHIFETYQAEDISYSYIPNPTVWTVRADGQLPTLAYARDNEVVGWSRQILGGFSDSGKTTAAKVKKVVTVPNTAGDSEDTFIVVERYINGATVHHIEYFTDHFDDSIALEDSFFVDCGGVYSGAAATNIGGLWWLEGEEVVCLADGDIVTGKTVTNGQITLDTAASKVKIGYKYKSVYESLPLRVNAFDGTGQARMSRIHQISIDFWKSLGGSVGPDSSTLETLNFTETETYVPGQPIPLKTGIMRDIMWPGGHDVMPKVYFEQEDPTPCNIRAFYPRMEMTDHG